METNKFNELLKKIRRRRTLRRVIAMLSIIMILTTMNTLKKQADTLERLAACGLAEHTHDVTCYDDAGAPICGLEEHVHTDACFQERPVSEPVQEIEVALGSDTSDGDVGAGSGVDVVPENLEAPVEEVLVDLGGEEQSEPVAAAAASVAAEPGELVFSLMDREFALASEIAAVADIDMALVSDVNSVLNDDDGSRVGIEAINGDWVIYANRDFAEAELAFFTNDGIEVVKLTDGYSISAQSVEQTAGEVDTFELTENGETENITGSEFEALSAIDESENTVIGENAVEADKTEAGQAGTEETDKEETDGVTEEADKDEAAQAGAEETDKDEVEQTEGEADKDEADQAEGETEETDKDEDDQSEGITEETDKDEDAQAEAEENDNEKTEQAEGEADKGEPNQSAGEAEETEKDEDAQAGAEETGNEKTEQAEGEADKGEDNESEGEAEEADKDEDAQAGAEETDNEKTEQAEGEADKGEADQAEGESEEADKGEDAQAGAEETNNEKTEQAESEADKDEADQSEGEADKDEADQSEGEAEETDKDDASQSEGEAEEADKEEDGQSEGEAEEADKEEADQSEEVTGEAGKDEAESEEGEEGKDEVGETDGETGDLAGEDTEEKAGDEAGAAVNTSTTIDLAEVETYPLSLRTLLAAFEPERTAEAEAPAGEAAEVEAPEELPEPEQQLPEILTPDEALALSVEYDDALLSIETTGDDRLITPIASFESTDILVGGAYTVTLLNGSVEEAPEIPYPPMTFEGSTDYVNVSVTADEGAFPEGTRMQLADVVDETVLTDIGDAAVADDFTEVQRVHAVDITFVNADDKEIEPLIPISVVMTVRELERDEETVVVHMDDEGNAAVVEETEPGEAPEDVAFSADAFSVYAVVVTKKLETRYITAEGETYNITVSYGSEAEIPAGATLDVREIEGDEAADYLTGAEEALAERKIITRARFFDIRILYGENEVQPAVPVTVQAVLANEETEAGDAPCAVHFSGEQADVVDAAQTGDTVVFRANGFSVWGVVYTVDFHYTFNGQTYEYSIPGGDCASLRELLPALGIVTDDPETGEDELADFMAAISDVTFSTSELVLVNKVEENTTVGALRAALGVESEYSATLSEADRAAIDEKALSAPDWALFSLKPFTTDESLTVAMKNGDSFTIAVTDAQITTRVLASDGLNYRITLTFGPEAEIPLDAELVAREIFSNDPNYIGYVVSAATRLSEEGLNNVSDYRFFDIEIRKDGEKIEPAAPVQVNITYEDALDLPEGAELSVVHFADEGIEVIRDIALNEDNTALSYEQASFSVSGTIVTGDPTPTYYESNVMAGRYMLIAVVDGERYIILNDGTLKKAESFTDTTVDVDFPMAWMYMNGDHLVHRADAVDYNSDKLASAFYWRYLDANKANALSEDTRDNTLRENNPEVIQANGRLIYPWTKIKYDPIEHTISNNTDNGPTYYIGVEGSNGELHVTGLNDREHAAEIYMAEITANTSDERMQVGAKYNTVNHIDIEVEGYANVTVPLRNGVYYYKDGNTVKSFEVTAQNPVGVKYEGKVPVTREDIKTARVVAYVKDGNVDKVRPDLFYIAGYSANDATDLSTNQVRIEGVYKVADLSHVTLTQEQLNSLTEEQRTHLKRNDDRTYNLDILTQGFGDGNENDFIRKLRLDNRVYYSVSTEKLVNFDMKYEGKQLYASYYDAMNPSDNNKLKAQAMITLSASFDFWDNGNECPPIYWTPANRYGETKVQYNYWKAGDIIVSVSSNNTMGIGMDFELGDKNQGQTGTLSAQITKYIVDRTGNRIHPNAPTENTFHVYWNQSIVDSQNVQGKNVGAYQNWEFTPSGYENIHDKRMTVGTEGTGTIYDYDVKPGMLYIAEDHSENRLARNIVDQDGKKWKYVETRLETEYVWRDDGCYGMNHVSKNYTTADANYNSNPEVLGNYSDVNGIGAFNGFVEFFVYNVYEPDVDIDVKKVWKDQNDAPTDAPAGTSVKITLGRYELVPTADYVDGALTITQHVVGGEAETPFQASYRLLKDGKLVKVGRYTGGNGGTTTISGIPAGEYTLEVKATAPGYTVTNTILPVSVTISSENPQASAVVNSTLVQNQTDNKRKITVTCGNQGGTTFHSLVTYLTEGMQFKLILDRRGPVHDSGLNIQINGTYTPYDWEKDPDIPAGDYTQAQINEFNSNELRVRQEYTYTVENSDMNLTIYHNWGPDDVRFTLQPIYDSGDTEAATGIGTVVQDPQGGTPSGSDGDGGVPSSNMTGLVYQVDDSYSEVITLKDGVWAATLHNLPSMNEYGPYLYYIVDETCTPENIVTKAEIWEDGEGHRLTSSGETVLGVTNYVQGDKPSIHIRKVDKDGHPLANAWFDLYDGDGTTKVVDTAIKSGSDGRCTFKDLVDGSYKLKETNSPPGYKLPTEMIPFTVSGGKIVFDSDNLPAGIKDLVDFDGETYTLTVENEPDVEQNQIKVLKRWQDVKGDEMDPSETQVKVRLRRHKITEKTKHLKVVVEIPLKYKNNGLDDIIKVHEENINGDTVSIQWDDQGQFDYDPRRLSWYSNEDLVNVVDTTNRTDEYHDKACFELQNLSRAAQNNIEVRFRYMVERMPSDDEINKNWFWNHINGTTISITQGDQPIHNPEESTDDTSFFDERTLNAGNDWSCTWTIVGTNDLPETKTFAAKAKNSGGISYKYYIEEIEVPEDYSVSYSENNDNGIQQGLITVYNRRNTADVHIVKVDKGNEATTLAGAEFTIRRLNPNQKGLAYDEGFEPSSKTTPANGKISFDKLPLGTYEIKETHLPDGYIQVGDGAFYIRITTNGVERIIKDTNLTPNEWQTVPSDDFVTFADSTALVRNTPGVALPSTGGIGTTVFYAIGSVLTLFAAVLLITKRRTAYLQHD